jgi:hypothetical protein
MVRSGRGYDLSDLPALPLLPGDSELVDRDLDRGGKKDEEGVEE